MQRGPTPSLLFAGVGRDFASSVPLIDRACAEMQRLMPHWAFVIYENNSTDDTRTALQTLASRYPQVIVHSEDIDVREIAHSVEARYADGKPCRIELIARARNRLLDLIDAPQFASYGHIVMCDLDHTSPIPVRRILKRVQRHLGTFDALIANGIDDFGRLYDSFAMRTRDVPFGPETIGEAFWSPQTQRKLMAWVAPWRSPLPIFSGFNGLAILRREAMAGLRYCAVADACMDRFNREMGAEQAQRDLGVGAALGRFRFQGSAVYYFGNSGCDQPVVCEHVPFFLAMRERGHDRIYLDPGLVWRWKRTGSTLGRIRDGIMRRLVRSR